MAPKEVRWQEILVMPEPKVRYPEIAARLVRIREQLGGATRGDQAAFATKMGFTKGQWNHWEQGYSIPWLHAVRITEKCPGLTLDYIYLGRLGGVPFDLLVDLGELPAELRRDR